MSLQVFNFTVGVKVEQHSQLLSKAEQDMTKLCNHRRKVVAMAALCRSMQASQLPFANLHYPGTLSFTEQTQWPRCCHTLLGTCTLKTFAILKILDFMYL